MALSDVTAEGVEHAIMEFDRLGREVFLAQFGFGQSRIYFLSHSGRRYDSKAIVGVAHGYDRPDLGPLQSEEFSGGGATVAPLLESLGFNVERLSRNPPWAEEELILALDLYLRSGPLNRSDPSVVRLSRVLNELTVHSVRPDSGRFRNPNGVAMKLANFAAIDPNYEGRGLTQGGRRDLAMWNLYASDEDGLSAIAEGIKEGRGLPTVATESPSGARVTKIEVESQHVERFEVSVQGHIIEANRREQSLVKAYAQHLTDRSHRVTRHRYQPDGSVPPLVCDLVDETDQMLYEAKGDVRRTSVRMAIGQLLDYRRFEAPSMKLAVLLPRRPTQDLIELIYEVPASVAWRTTENFTIQHPCEPTSF